MISQYFTRAAFYRFCSLHGSRRTSTLAISKSGEVHFFVALPNERKTSTNGGTLAPALSMKALVS
jgi:hypothetical protein